MMGEQARTESLFYYFRLKNRFPKITCCGCWTAISISALCANGSRPSTVRPVVRRLTPKCCCACCWSAICTALPVSGVCWMKCGCTWRIGGSLAWTSMPRFLTTRPSPRIGTDAFASPEYSEKCSRRSYVGVSKPAWWKVRRWPWTGPWWQPMPASIAGSGERS